MKTLTTSMALLLFAGVALAQERVPQEQAEKVAKACVEQSAKLENAQLKLELAADKPYGLSSGKYAALAIPDKNLTEDKLAKAGKEIMPVGQLWLRNLAPALDGKATPNDKLRIVKVTLGNESEELPLLLLGVRQNKEGAPELVVYAKDKDPLLTLPLKKADVRQELPIELEARKGDKDTATVTLNLQGKYQATLTVAERVP